MKILVVDNYNKRLQHLAGLLSSAFPDAEIETTIDPLMAGKYSFNNRVDILFAGLEMKRMNGMELGRFVRKNSPMAKVYLLGLENEHKDTYINPEENINGLLLYPFSAERIEAIAETIDMLEEASAI